jgi:molybdopterin-binding protein
MFDIAPEVIRWRGGGQQAVLARVVSVAGLSFRTFVATRQETGCRVTSPGQGQHRIHLPHPLEPTVRLSTRNQLPGTITSIQQGEAMAVIKVALDGGGPTITSSITREAVEDLGLAEGTNVTVLIKSTDVGLAVE